jgi:hypothetical protein
MGFDTGEKVGIVVAIVCVATLIGIKVWAKAGGGYFMRIGNTEIEIQYDHASINYGAQSAMAIPWRFDRNKAPRCVQELTDLDTPLHQVTLLRNGEETYHLFVENAGCGDCMLYVLALYLCLDGSHGPPPSIEALRGILDSYIRLHSGNVAFGPSDTLADWAVAENLIPSRDMTYGAVESHLVQPHTGHGIAPTFADMGVSLTFLHLKAFACAYNTKVRVWKNEAGLAATMLVPAGDLLPTNMLFPDEDGAPFCNVFVATTSTGGHIMLLGALLTHRRDT